MPFFRKKPLKDTSSDTPASSSSIKKTAQEGLHDFMEKNGFDNAHDARTYAREKYLNDLEQEVFDALDQSNQ